MDNNQEGAHIQPIHIHYTDQVVSQAASLQDADCIRLIPLIHRGKGEIVPLIKKDSSDPSTYTFCYQRDTYILSSMSPITFVRLPYPSSSRPLLSTLMEPEPLAASQVDALLAAYGKNEFNIPIPTFSELFGEHATAPFFVFQIFCVGLWCLDEYVWYSLFTLFMLVVFECTVVWQARFLCPLCRSDDRLTHFYSECAP
jgi:cation-transporting ATPase 13A1